MKNQFSQLVENYVWHFQFRKEKKMKFWHQGGIEPTTFLSFKWKFEFKLFECSTYNLKFVWSVSTRTKLEKCLDCWPSRGPWRWWPATRSWEKFSTKLSGQCQGPSTTCQVPCWQFRLWRCSLSFWTENDWRKTLRRWRASPTFKNLLASNRLTFEFELLLQFIFEIKCNADSPI